VKFDFVAKHRGTWPVGMLGDVLGVSASGFYARTVRPESARARAKAALAVALHQRFRLSDRTYGARRPTGRSKNTRMTNGMDAQSR
jgi:putative transposase